MTDNVTVVDKQSSVEVTQNAKGQYAFKVKLYFNEEETDADKVVQAVENIYGTLHEKF